MICQNCGNQVQPGTTVCPYCNMPLQPQPVQQPMNQPMQPQQPAPQPMGQPMPQQPMYNQPMGPQPMPVYNAQPVKVKHHTLHIILGIIGAVVVIFVIIIIVGLANSKKLTCKNGSETITIRYTDTDIIACSHIGGTGKCDLETLQNVAKSSGVSLVINSLKTELTNQGFTCTE